MAETFYRIKNSEGEYLGITHDSMEWDTARQASTWGDHASADDMAKFARKHYDPTARVVKTTLKKLRVAGPWVDVGMCCHKRFDDWGAVVAFAGKIAMVYPGRGKPEPHADSPQREVYERGVALHDNYQAYATHELADAACDDELRKLGWVLA